MPDMIDRRDRADLFRRRLAGAMAQLGTTQSALARATAADRSTISALLSPGTRLPNAQLAADCAQALNVSTDWLLGLTDRPDPPDVLMDRAVELVPASRALFEETVFDWHRQAAGFKIRHVPATLPDMLKTEAVVEWEYRDHLGDHAAQSIAAFQTQLGWLRGARSDYEFALPVHELQAFVTATGYWSGIPSNIRANQLDHLISLCDELYPAMRLYLFDAHRVFSAPVTIFGPQRAVVYLGRQYMVFRDPGKITDITRHFDWLVRAANMGARDLADHLARLRQSLG